MAAGKPGNMGEIKAFIQKSKKPIPTGMDPAAVTKELKKQEGLTKSKGGGKKIDLNQDLNKYQKQGQRKADEFKSKGEIKTSDPGNLKYGGTMKIGDPGGGAAKSFSLRSPGESGGSKADELEGHLLFLNKAFGPSGPKWMRD